MGGAGRDRRGRKGHGLLLEFYPPLQVIPRPSATRRELPAHIEFKATEKTGIETSACPRQSETSPSAVFLHPVLIDPSLDGLVIRGRPVCFEQAPDLRRR